MRNKPNHVVRLLVAVTTCIALGNVPVGAAAASKTKNAAGSDQDSAELWWQRDYAATGVPNDVRPFHAEMPQQAQRIRRLVLDTETSFMLRAFGKSATVTPT